MLHEAVKASKARSSYKIVVHPEPDPEMAEQGTPYFWAILKWSGKGWHNVACDWSKTRLGAFRDADWKYDVLMEELSKNPSEKS